MKLSIIIPAYNESKRIDKSLEMIYKFMRTIEVDYEVIISDDGSTDDTKEIVKRFQSEWKSLRLIENIHKGKAPAIISGILSSKGDFVLFTDIDLSVPIDELPKLLTWVENEGYDIAIATREGPGAKRIGEPILRHVMGRVFNLLVQLVLLPGINDTQCGFKLFRREVAIKIFNKTLLYSIDDPEITGAKVSGFDVEILYIAKKLGYKIKEVPITWTYMDNSKVHRIKDSYYNAKDVLKVRLNDLMKKYR